MLGEKILQLDLKISFENGPRKLQVNKFQKVVLFRRKMRDFLTYSTTWCKQKGHYENH